MALKLSDKIRAGDSLKFTVDLADYPADVWTLSYTINNASNSYTVTAGADGETHSMSVLPAVTELWTAGDYRYFATVTDGVDRYTVQAGHVQILPNLAAGAVDDRAHVEKVLVALEATLENKATNDQLTLSINGRSLTRMNVTELLAWRDRYRGELARIKQAENIDAGLNSNQIRVRFL